MPDSPRTPRRWLRSALGLLAATAACGGGDPGRDGDPVITTYEGVLAIGSESSAAITLVSRVPPAGAVGAAGVTPTEPGANAGDATAIGTIRSSDLGTVHLSGNYNTTTRTFSLQGSGYQITANVQSDNTVSGTGTHGSTPLAVVAVASTADSPSASFCGSFEGTYRRTSPTPLEERGWGTIHFVIDGQWSGREWRHEVRGFAVETSEVHRPSFALQGAAFLTTKPSTLGTSQAYMVGFLVGAPSSSVEARWENHSWVGTYTTSDGVGQSDGTWWASSC